MSTGPSDDGFALQAEQIMASQRRDARRFAMGVRASYALLLLALFYAFSGSHFTVAGLQFTTITLGLDVHSQPLVFHLQRGLADDTVVGPVDCFGDSAIALGRVGASIEIPARLCAGDLLHFAYQGYAFAPAGRLFLPGAAATWYSHVGPVGGGVGPGVELRRLHDGDNAGRHPVGGRGANGRRPSQLA